MSLPSLFLWPKRIFVLAPKSEDPSPLIYFLCVLLRVETVFSSVCLVVLLLRGAILTLALLCDDQVTTPPFLLSPRVTEWGPYEEALQGRPVFVHRYNIATENFFTYQGHGVTTQAHQSIIHGTQYSWDARAFGTALLWRTLRDTDSYS
jgi:hypothetical protein